MRIKVSLHIPKYQKVSKLVLIQKLQNRELYCKDRECLLPCYTNKVSNEQDVNIISIRDVIGKQYFNDISKIDTMLYRSICNQTHLNQRMKVFRIRLKIQCEFFFFFLRHLVVRLRFATAHSTAPLNFETQIAAEIMGTV